MPFKKGEGGRPRGSKGAFTSLKNAFLEAFTGIGGARRLQAWGNKNPKEFYQILARMLPNETALTGKDGGPVTIEIIKKYLAIAEQVLPEVGPEKEKPKE